MFRVLCGEGGKEQRDVRIWTRQIRRHFGITQHVPESITSFADGGHQYAVQQPVRDLRQPLPLLPTAMERSPSLESFDTINTTLSSPEPAASAPLSVNHERFYMDTRSVKFKVRS